MDIIKISCYRGTSNWSKTSSADLVAAIQQPTALRPMTLLDFFQRLLAAGAIKSEIAPLYDRSEFIRDLKDNLQSGDLAGVAALASLAEDIVTLSQTTIDAIASVLSTNSLRLVDVVAAELGETAPKTVTAADVDAALGR